MRFCIVVILGECDKVVAGIATDPNLELVAIFDALDLLQFGIGAAALTRSRVVFQCVTELELRGGLFEFYVESGIQSAERHGERVIAFEHKADCFAWSSLFHEGATGL